MKNDFQALTQKFFLGRLMSQLNASSCTIASYRDAFRLFLKYELEIQKRRPDEITLQNVADDASQFLDHLKKTRGNKAQTLNSRLSALKSFFTFISYEFPEYSDLCRQVIKMPLRRTTHKEIAYLTKNEIKILLNSCDESAKGRRDRLMLLLLFNTGMRVSELTALKGDSVVSQNERCILHIEGKGRKSRSVPLWKDTRKLLEAHIFDNDIKKSDYLISGEKFLTRSGVRYRIDQIVIRAMKNCPSFEKKSVSPHVFRHSTAMALLQAGIDISTIAIWLGHESIETTHKYMVADIELKQKALQQISAPRCHSSRRRYEAKPDLMYFLENL
jgi:site-specific recombinase XerD